MPERWFDELAGRMRAQRIANKELARFMGFTETYVSLVLNGKKEPEGASERWTKAVEELIAQKNVSA